MVICFFFWVLPFQSIIYMYKTIQSALFSSCHMSSVTTSGRRATQPPRSSTRCRSLSATTSPWRRSARSSRRRTVRSVNWNTVRRRKRYNVRLQVGMYLQTIRSRVTVVRGQKVRARQPSLASCLRHRRREAMQQSAFIAASSVMSDSAFHWRQQYPQCKQHPLETQKALYDFFHICRGILDTRKHASMCKIGAAL